MTCVGVHARGNRARLLIVTAFEFQILTAFYFHPVNRPIFIRQFFGLGCHPKTDDPRYLKFSPNVKITIFRARENVHSFWTIYGYCQILLTSYKLFFSLKFIKYFLFVAKIKNLSRIFQINFSTYNDNKNKKYT